jgi:integrase
VSPVHIKTRLTKSGKRYLVYYRRGGRETVQQYAGSFRRLREAQLRRDLVAGWIAVGLDPKVELAALLTPPQRGPSLSVRWEEFIASRVDVGRKAKAQYRNARDRWLPILGSDRDPSTVTAQDVIEGISELYDGGEGLAPSTIAQYVSNLGMVFDFCELEPNPARSPRVKLPAGRRTERQIPHTPAWVAIRDQARKRSRLALRLQEACAFRVSEATLLEWGDLDFIEGMARIRRDATKTNAGRRWVPIPGELLEEIEALLPVEDRSTHRRVLGVGSNAVYVDLQKACTDAGVIEYGTHALRHRRISLWLRHGIDPVQVTRWAGHARSSLSLDVYGHLILDPREDEWRSFWLDVYGRSRAPGGAPVGHEETE